MFDRDSSTGRLSSSSSQSVLAGVAYTDGIVAALALSAGTLFVSIAGTASGGGGIGQYNMNVRGIGGMGCGLLEKTETSRFCYLYKMLTSTLGLVVAQATRYRLGRG